MDDINIKMNTPKFSDLSSEGSLKINNTVVKVLFNFKVCSKKLNRSISQINQSLYKIGKIARKSLNIENKNTMSLRQFKKYLAQK